mmetsp:Transcript_23939/g.34808  ORF Transcript_23939/g.34808 Transcript_23939/m.34808 type:complete len:99 (-) Transcript_23939:139-435(-)
MAVCHDECLRVVDLGAVFVVWFPGFLPVLSVCGLWLHVFQFLILVLALGFASGWNLSAIGLWLLELQFMFSAAGSWLCLCFDYGLVFGCYCLPAWVVL